MRPGDANETAACWRTILEHADRPAGLVLSRQNLPVLARTDHSSDSTSDGAADGDRGRSYASARGAARGGYVLADSRRNGESGSPAEAPPDVILVATGSEVQIALDARTRLLTEGLAVRVVSMPCREWFAAQPTDYQDAVLPPAVRARVSVEAAIGQGWRDVVGDAGRIVSLEHYGASADYATLYREFGITTDAVVQGSPATASPTPPAPPAQADTRTAPHRPPAGPATVPLEQLRRAQWCRR